MVTHSFGFRLSVSSAIIAAWLSGALALAAPPHSKIKFTPPLGTVKTIQVTETMFEAQDGPPPGPLGKPVTMTFRIERPDKFRIDMRESDPSKPQSYYISDGKTLVSYDGRTFRSQPTARAEWPFPMMGLLNNMPGPVSCEPAVRAGRKVLLAVRSSKITGRDEYWFDPQTHLLLRWLMFMTWKGKTREIMRTDYSGWALNKPIPASVFQIPSAATKQK